MLLVCLIREIQNPKTIAVEYAFKGIILIAPNNIKVVPLILAEIDVGHEEKMSVQVGNIQPDLIEMVRRKNQIGIFLRPAAAPVFPLNRGGDAQNGYDDEGDEFRCQIMISFPGFALRAGCLVFVVDVKSFSQYHNMIGI